MKTLVIAEKPSVARDIVGALPGTFDEHKNFYESDDYVVTFAVGHLLELSDPEDYDPALEDVAARRTCRSSRTSSRCGRATRRPTKQLKLIHKLLKRDGRRPRHQRLRRRARGRADLHAHLRDRRRRQAGRPPLDQLDDEAGDPRRLRAACGPATQVEPLRDAARSRSEADWLVGMNATRAATVRRRLGRRRRLARPRADADARDDRQARARDPGVRARAVLARPRDLRPALRGPLVRGRRDAAQGRQARRRDRREGHGQDRPRRVGRAQGAVRARAAPLRPHLAPARREPPLRLLRAPHAAARRSRCTRARRRSPTRARTRASSPATSSRS